MAEKKKLQKWTRLTKRRIYWLGTLFRLLLRLGIKILLTYGYRMMFGLAGIDVGIVPTVLAWITSYWLATEVLRFISYRILPEEVKEELYPFQLDSEFTVVLVIKALNQLLFYTTDETEGS